MKITTPYFVLEKDILESEIQSLKSAISLYWDNSIIAYSVKTNSLPYLAKLMNGYGIYAEVVSEDEFNMVKFCGYKSSNIVCNGPIKNKNFIFNLLSEHSIINIDSHAELDYVKEYAVLNSAESIEVCIRVNLDIEKDFPDESKAGKQGSRFGFCVENNEFHFAIKSLREKKNIKIVGLHLHVSTSTRKVEIYRWLSLKFVELVKKYDLFDIKYFDIGGGFYGGLPGMPTWKDYMKEISSTLSEEGFSKEAITLILEPGVSLLAGAFSYYMSVVDVKDTNLSRFVVMDGSRIHIDPFFHKKTYFYEKKCSKDSRDIITNQKLVGFTCLEYDNLMELDNQPELKVGDIIKCNKVGAYTISLSPLFISYFPEVYIRENNGILQCVRNRWTFKEFIQLSKL